MSITIRDVLVFGAGASFGSGEVKPKPPPMTDGLFTVMQRLFPAVCRGLSQECVDLLLDDFEAGMRMVGEVNSHMLPPLQRSMASFFFGFYPGENNLYRRIARKVIGVEWSGAFVSFNYERLLEIALITEGLQPFVGQRPDGEKYVEICLPHGCCHIFCDSVRGAANVVSFAGFNVSTHGQVSVVVNPVEFNSRIRNDAFPPVMSYFELEKRTSSGVNFIEEQRKRYIDLISDAKTVIVIGLKVRQNDKHIWDAIAETKAKIVYCSGKVSGDEFANWANEKRAGKDNLIIRKYFDESFDLICGEVGLDG